MNDNRLVLLHVSLIAGLSSTLTNKLYELFGNQDLAQLYTFLHDDFLKAGFTMSQAQRLVQGLADKAILERECALLEKHSIQIVTLFDESYPALLRHIHMPPAVLYAQGTLSCLEQAFAVVGSRAADDYAHEAIKAIVPSLVAHGWTIVSGGALGADTMAHEAALSSKGITVAVLGSGLLRPYPTKNKSLFQTIYTEGGAVVSPFPLLSDPLPGNFPARNRIISGLSRGCLVVQAAEKSGASITAHCALDQGRDVFAVPGLLNNPLSHGCHRLIQQGAKLVTSAQDILVEYGQDEVQEVSEQLSLVSPELESPQPLTPEGLLIQSCKKPKAIDELVQLTGKSLHEVQESLFNLQLEGVITQDFAGLWVCRG